MTLPSRGQNSFKVIRYAVFNEYLKGISQKTTSLIQIRIQNSIFCFEINNFNHLKSFFFME